MQPETTISAQTSNSTLASQAPAARLWRRFAYGGRRRLLVAALVLVVLGLAGSLVLALEREPELPDLRIQPAGAERKAAFFEFMTPIVEQRNDEILATRARLLRLAQQFVTDNRLSILDRFWLEKLADRYRVEWRTDDIGTVLKQLERRVDVVPEALVLVQAAKESGWGTSRFAREANNLFGQWCYREGCGLVPARRAAGARHEVRYFESVPAAVDAYLHNINTGKSYARLRDIRQRLRQRGRKPVASDLADGLLFYSQRRMDYVEEVKSMLRQYHKFQQKMRS